MKRQPAVEDFVRWMKSKGYAILTQAQYSRIVERWLRSRKTARDWILSLESDSAAEHDGRPTDTANIYKRALITYLRFRDYDVSQLRDLPQPVHRHHTTRTALTSDQEQRLRDVLFMDGPVPEPMRTCLLLLLFTGLRQAEARALRFSDVLPVEGGGMGVRVKGLKGTPDRFVPLTLEARTVLVAYLRGWRTEYPGQLLFPGKNPLRPMTPSALTRRTQALGRMLGIPGLSPHVLRHTLATRLLEAGVAERTTQAVLGHTSSSMTRHYQHPGAKTLADALELAQRS